VADDGVLLTVYLTGEARLRTAALWALVSCHWIIQHVQHALITALMDDAMTCQMFVFCKEISSFQEI